MTKLSTATAALLTMTAATTTAATETTQDWYAATQARSLLTQILHRNDAQYSHSKQQRHLSENYHGSRSFQKLQSTHQPPTPIDLLNSLSQYDKLWIEIEGSSSSSSSSSRKGPCVWSECALDNVDDEYTGDNRDGDEQWYQFRTQEFCANAAYSLYGRKKMDVWGKFGDCTQRHFINSFFTYGGSDNLLTAVGQSPGNYLGGDSNADCVANENGGYSTLGCAADGEFLIGNFDGYTCDGNYFNGGDSSGVTGYNSNFNKVGCHAMDPSSNLSALKTLLSNSWACDVRTFGDTCPDPYQRKGYYEYALQTAQNGGNPIRAYNRLVWKSELRLFSWTLLVISLVIFFAGFSIKQCAVKKKADGSIVGNTSYDDQLSPTASAMTVGSTLFELEDGGKLKKIMEDVSAKTLKYAAWVQWKVGMGKEPEEERTFQTSSPEKSVGGAAEGYKSPESKSGEVQLTRSTTPSQARMEMNMVDSTESGLEMAPPTSPDKPWVTMEPRQSLQ